MNEEQLKQLSNQLNIDFLVLQKIFNKFKPKDRTELLKITNDIVGLQGQLNTQDLDSVINYYESIQQSQTNVKNESLDKSEVIQPSVVQLPQTQEQTVQVPGQSQIQTQPQVQRQAASVNFEDKFGQGYQFKPQGNNDLTGQCAWFAQQVTTLPDGSNWTIGNTIQDKRRQLQSHRQRGNAFLKGEGQPEVGNSVVLDTGTQYGHVAVISEVLPDGRIRLTESNWDNDQKVRHDRIINPNDQNVIGFVKSKPTQEFRIEPPKTSPEIPSTPEIKQSEPAAAEGKQELPIEQQALKQEILETPEIETRTQELPQENKNVGFLDIFAKNGQVIKPEDIKPEITRPVIPEVKPPAIKPEIKQPQSVTPQSMSINIPKPQVENIRQPIIQSRPILQSTQPIQRQPQTSRIPMPIRRQNLNPIKNVVNKVVGIFRR